MSAQPKEVGFYFSPTASHELFILGCLIHLFICEGSNEALLCVCSGQWSNLVLIFFTESPRLSFTHSRGTHKAVSRIGEIANGIVKKVLAEFIFAGLR